MTKTGMDGILASANGDISVIESKLGIPPGAWQAKELVRIDIPTPRDLNLQMPSGNEAGANPLWIPGGTLRTGQLEAVINSIPKRAICGKKIMELNKIAEKKWTYTLYESDGNYLLSVICGGAAMYELNIPIALIDAKKKQFSIFHI